MVLEVPRDAVISLDCLCRGRKHPSASGEGLGAHSGLESSGSRAV